MESIYQPLLTTIEIFNAKECPIKLLNEARGLRENFEECNRGIIRIRYAPYGMRLSFLNLESPLNKK